MCCRDCGVSPKIIQRIEEKLCETFDIFPGVTVACIMDRTATIVSVTASGKKEEYSAHQVLSMKKTATQFAEILSSECSVVHIKGSSGHFSCYDMDQHLVLVHCTLSEGLNLSQFNTHSADEKMKAVLSDLRLLTAGLVVKT